MIEDGICYALPAEEADAIAKRYAREILSSPTPDTFQGEEGPGALQLWWFEEAGYTLESDLAIVLWEHALESVEAAA